MDISTYASFIEDNGSELEKARFRRLFFGAKPEPTVVRNLTGLQNDDGGFPCRMTRGNPSSINDTLRALNWLDELGMLASPEAKSALDYLLAVQKDDGGWDEVPAATQYGTPPWASPGQLRARMYLTAQCAYWLVVSGRVNHPAFRKSLGFLLRHREETGRFRGFLHTTWIATGVLAMAGEEYSGVVEQGLHALMAKPVAEWVDSQISWALEYLSRAGVSEDAPFVRLGLAQLLHRYEVNGRWESEDGEAYTVGATIGALKVLKSYGLLGGREAPR